MDEIMNLLPVLAFIVFGIIKAISGGDSNQQEKQSPKRPTVPKPAIPKQAPSGETHKPKQTVYRTDLESVYVEQQQKQQLGELALNTDSAIAPIDNIAVRDSSLGTAIRDEIKHHSSNKLSENQAEFRKDVKNALNRKGLVQSVIMSEVLGPPRARRPYNSVVQDRIRNTR